MLAVSFAAVAPTDDIDAKPSGFTLEGGNKISMEKGATVTLRIHYNSDINTTLRLVITDKANPHVDVYKQDVVIKVGQDNVIEVPFSYDKGSSPVYMKISFFQGGLTVGHIDFEVNYTSSIWSNPALYVAIIIVVILIIAFIVYKVRTAPKRDKNTLTFEQIEAQRMVQMQGGQDQGEQAAKSEKHKYHSPKRRKE
jgi:hypothetical protein